MFIARLIASSKTAEYQLVFIAMSNASSEPVPLESRVCSTKSGDGVGGVAYVSSIASNSSCMLKVCPRHVVDLEGVIVNNETFYNMEIV